MGSELSTIRSLLENQIDSGEPSASSDPSSAILNTYINQSIRKIVRKDRPHELYSATVSAVNISADANTVSIPSGIFVPELVYYQYSSGSIFELRQKPLKRMIELESSNNFFDTSNTGNPSYYDVRGTSLIFNKYFDRTATGAVKIYGIGPPSTLSDDDDATELPVDYDLLIVYEAAVLFYQKDDDLQNQQKFEALAFRERADLRTFLRTNTTDVVELDPHIFGGSYGSPKSDAGVFFGS